MANVDEPQKIKRGFISRKKVIFDERWRTLSNVGGCAMWWARQDSNLQPDRLSGRL